MLVLKDIYKWYGDVPALRGVSAEIEDGEFVSFLGPSGCGKTTLLRIVSGLIQPDRGEVVLDGRVINDVPPDRRGIQMCFQNYALFPHLTVAGNIGYGPAVHGWPKRRIAERVEELLDLVQLSGLGDRHIVELSGGQQQRVALARALALEPKVVLLDEPLSNLDASLRVRMRSTLREIQRKVNITTIFVTHDQVEAMTMSDRLVVMNHGLVEQIGTPVEIYETPKTEAVARFIGYVNLFEGVVVAVDGARHLSRVRTSLGEIEAALGHAGIAPGDRIHVVIRPETVRLNAHADEGSANAFRGEVRNVEYAGSTVKYTVDVAGTEVIVDQYDPTSHGIHRIGEPVAIELPREVHVLHDESKGVAAAAD
ncbi:MAG TPA: ABC transporter ATP-binding protein [Geminicoccaceae bacterium]|nr:ABC transporter ATP-binding protein [Geminicoccaceae bacterium]